MKNKKRIWKFIGGAIGLTAIACIIPACVVSCGSSSNSSSSSSSSTNSTSSTSSSSSSQTSIGIAGSTLSEIATNWSNQFSKISQNNFATTISNYLTNYAKDASTYFSNFANEYKSLTNPNLPASLNGYVNSELKIEIHDIFDKISGTNDYHTLMDSVMFWKLDSVQFDAKSLTENASHQFSFDMTYNESYDFVVDASSLTKSGFQPNISTEAVTVQFTNVTFAPTLIAQINNSLNTNNSMINVYGGWYMNGGMMSFNHELDALQEMHSTTVHSVNFQNATNPTTSSWISSPSAVDPTSLAWVDMMKDMTNEYSSTGSTTNPNLNSLWYQDFEAPTIIGYANDGTSLYESTNTISNPNLSSLSTLKTQNLNVTLLHDSSSSEPSPGTTSSSSDQEQITVLQDEITAMENEYPDVFTGHLVDKTEFDHYMNQATEDSSNPSEELTDLQSAYDIISNLVTKENATPTSSTNSNVQTEIESLESEISSIEQNNPNIFKDHDIKKDEFDHYIDEASKDSSNPTAQLTDLENALSILEGLEESAE